MRGSLEALGCEAQNAKAAKCGAGDGHHLVASVEVDFARALAKPRRHERQRRGSATVLPQLLSDAAVCRKSVCARAMRRQTGSCVAGPSVPACLLEFLLAPSLPPCQNQSRCSPTLCSARISSAASWLFCAATYAGVFPCSRALL